MKFKWVPVNTIGSCFADVILAKLENLIFASTLLITRYNYLICIEILSHLGPNQTILVLPIYRSSTHTFTLY